MRNATFSPIINFKPHGDISYSHPSTDNTHTHTNITFQECKNIPEQTLD